ncbi:LPXTG cell wall anchor domain-containing protein [Streptomyces sp. R44]|uniref:LPXTG cell wall anchor domain-containing protein n=1 Tax=Streptomyces sp. R44 TaxID=3238633 RepID=A0AB39SUK0_9ACTN
MRRSLIPAAALVAAMAGSLALAPVASASGGPKGDNGTVKIHDSKTGEEIKANEPKVCEFYLDAFNFDASQKAIWRIEAWANNDQDKGTEVKNGAITLDADGHGRTEDLNLDNGQYKLFWNFDGENGKAKHKVFKVDCEKESTGGTTGEQTAGGSTTGEQTTGGSTTGETTTGGTTTGETTATGGSTTGETTTGGTTTGETTATGGSTTGETTAGGSTGGSASGETATGGAAGGSEEGNLAETGSSAPVGILAAAALALAAAGAVLVTRRRKATQN